jgi:hypothetical protein
MDSHGHPLPLHVVFAYQRREVTFRLDNRVRAYLKRRAEIDEDGGITAVVVRGVCSGSHISRGDTADRLRKR